MTALELGVLDWIQAALRTPLADRLMVGITQLGSGGILWIVWAAVLLRRPETRRQSAAVLLALGLSALCCNLTLKPLVARTRPCDLNAAVSLLVARPADYSFPSGHTSSSFAAAAALCFSGAKYRWLAVVLAVLIGFSRLYLYVHFPTDVLAGAALGTLLGAVGSCTAGKIWGRQNRIKNS